MFPNAAVCCFTVEQIRLTHSIYCEDQCTDHNLNLVKF